MTYRVFCHAFLAISFFAATAIPCSAADVVAQWDDSFLNPWSDTTRWTTSPDNSPIVPNNSGNTFEVVINEGNVIQDVPGGVTIATLHLQDAFLSGSESVTIAGDPADPLLVSTWVGSTQNTELWNTGGVTVASGATPEPVEAETEAEETAQEDTNSTAPSESPRFNKVSPGILEKLPDYVRPTKKRSWQESAEMLEQMRPDRSGAPAEPAYDPSAAMKALRNELMSVLTKQHRERLAAAEKTCGEQRKESATAEEQEESANTEVCEKAADPVS